MYIWYSLTFRLLLLLLFSPQREIIFLILIHISMLSVTFRSHFIVFQSIAMQLMQYFLRSFRGFLFALPLNSKFRSHSLCLLYCFLLFTSPRTWSVPMNVCSLYNKFLMCVFSKWDPCNVLKPVEDRLSWIYSRD